MTDRRPTPRGSLVLRPAPAGLPDVHPTPPVIAESGDPFAALRVVAVIACLERGRSLALADVVDALNARHLDWWFDARVVTDALVALQANWMVDYRNQSGIVVEDGPYGPTVEIEDSSRVDPWMVRQAQRLAADCRTVLAEFSRRETSGPGV